MDGLGQAVEQARDVFGERLVTEVCKLQLNCAMHSAACGVGLHVCSCLWRLEVVGPPCAPESLLSHQCLLSLQIIA